MNYPYKILRAVSDIKIGIPIIISSGCEEDLLCVLPAESVDEKKFNSLKILSEAKIVIPEKRIDSIMDTNFASDIVIPIQNLNFDILQKILGVYPKKVLCSLLHLFEDVKELDCMTIDLMHFAELFPTSLSFKLNKESKSVLSDIYDVQIEHLSMITLDMFYDHLIKKPEISLVSSSKMFFAGSTLSGLSIYQDELKQHVVITFNSDKFGSPLLRVHSSCYTGDLLESLTCDCNSQLRYSIEQLKKYTEGGILIYLSQEGRGIGLSNKIRCYELQHKMQFDTVMSNKIIGFPDDCRDFRVVGQIIKKLGIGSVSMLTNNLDKARMVEESGVKIINRFSANYIVNQHNTQYLQSKKKLMNHDIGI